MKRLILITLFLAGISISGLAVDSNTLDKQPKSSKLSEKYELTKKEWLEFKLQYGIDIKLLHKRFNKKQNVFGIVEIDDMNTIVVTLFGKHLFKNKEWGKLKNEILFSVNNNINGYDWSKDLKINIKDIE